MPQEPRVIHLDDGREWRGGQHQVSLLIDALARRGVAQMLAAPPGSPLMKWADARSDVAQFHLDSWGELDLGAGRALARTAMMYRANILHAHTAHAHAIALAAHKKLGPPEGAPRLLVTRRVDFPVGRGFFSARKYRYPHQRFIAISRGVRDVLIKGGVDAERIEIVASGVPPIPAERALSREASRREFGIGEGETAIVNVGALVDHKGHRFLIEAAAEVARKNPSARFWILGEGDLRGELEKLIEARGLKGIVQLAGHVADARLKLAGFDHYASSSHLEGLGTSILDAMLAGLPVVAAAAGGVPDIVEHGKTGRLAPPADAAALAAEIIASIESPADERARLIGSARANVEARFSAESMAEGNLAAYRRMLAGA